MSSQKTNRSALSLWIFVALFYTAIMGLTEPPNVGDTMAYADNIQRAVHGSMNLPFHPLWEFGHLLWRPLGFLLDPLFQALAPDSLAPSPSLKTAFGLVWLNLAAGLLTVLLALALIRRGFAIPVASLWLIAIAFCSGAGFLLYAQAGTSYVFALPFIFAATMILFIWPDSSRWPAEVPASLALLAAVLFWFPFILIAPAIALLPSLREGKLRLRPLLLAASAFTLPLILSYAAGAWFAGIHTLPEFLAWFANSKHELGQTKQWIRAVSGVCRLLFDLSNDGVLIKRILLRDPYSATGLSELLPTVLRMACFYGICLLSLVGTWMQASLRYLVYVFFVAALPMLFFAIFLFEPSAAERFFPLLPFLFLLIAAALTHSSPWLRNTLAVLLISIPAANLPILFAWGQSSHPGALRLVDFKQAARPGDLIFTITMRDPIINLVEQHPFDKLNHPQPVLTRQLIEVASANAKHWRRDFARLVLDAGSRPGIWIDRAVLSPTPPGYLMWVEADNPNVVWKQIPDFFAPLQFEVPTQRPDGFFRLAATDENILYLKAFADSKP